MRPGNVTGGNALWRWTVAAFFLLSLVISAGGYWFYRTEINEIRHEEYQKLSTIARLKVDQIDHFRKERLRDVALLASSPTILKAIGAVPAGVGARTVDAETLQHLAMIARMHDYEDVLLLDVNRNVMAAVRDGSGGLSAATRTAIEIATSGRNAGLSDLYLSADGKVYLEAVDVVRDESSAPVAIVVLRTDAGTYLYPLLQSWFTPSRTGETLMVQSDGEDVLYLNDLRHVPGAALALRVPLARTDSPCVQAAMGRTGRFEGRDYRGVKVIAHFLTVPDSPWGLVAKVDSSEINDEARERAVMITLMVGAFILTLGAWAALFYRSRQKLHFRSLYEIERSLRESRETLGTALYSLGDAVVITDVEGRVQTMNPAAEALTGLKESEACGAPWDQVCCIAPEAASGGETNPVLRVLHDGTALDIAGYSRLTSRTDREHMVSVTAAPIRGCDAAIAGVVVVFHDRTGERLAQRHLEESEERLRLALSAADQGLYDLNVQTGECIVNPEYARMLGYDPTDFVETNAAWRERLHPEDHGAVVRAYEDYIAGRRPEYRVEFRQRTRSSDWKWILSLGKVVEHASDGRPLRMLGTHTDISERKLAEHRLIESIAEAELAEQALRQSEAKYRRLHESMRDAFVAVDMSGRIIEFNPAFKAMIGYTEEELLRLTYQHLTPERWHSMESRIVSEEILPRGYSDVYEKEYRRADGTVFPVELRTVLVRDDAGEPEMMWAIVRDITERELFESKLTESEERYRQIVESATDAILVRTGEEIVYANPAAVKLLHAARLEDLLGKRYIDLVHPDDRTESMERVRRGVEHGTVAAPREHRLVALDGQVVHVESTGVAIPYRGRVQLFGVFRDIGERRQLEAQFRQAQKMEAVGRLAGGVAHDFNNMLGVIQGFTELAMMKIAQNHSVRPYLEEIDSAAQRSIGITRQLLAFARQQTIAPKILDLNDTIAGMLKILRRLVGEEIDLVWKPGNDLWPVKMDPSQVDQLLANLIVNARDAIERSGEIGIETRNEEVTPERCLARPGLTPGRYVALAVRDTGSGMDPATLARAFEPFFTTKELGKGTGLGLSTVYGIVKQNGGFIDVVSSPGRGTTFTLFLPRRDPDSAGSSVERPSVETPMGSETVLLVEDEKPLLKFATILLEELGYAVLSADGPQVALRLAEGHSGDIDLMLTDVVMPRLNGYELWEQLKIRRPGLKCLFMSGYSTDVIADSGVLHDGVHFIHKPFSREVLARKMREVLSP